MLTHAAPVEAALVLTIGIAIYWANPKRTINRLILVGSVYFALWLSTLTIAFAVPVGTGLPWVRLTCALGAFIPSHLFALKICLTDGEEKNWKKLIPWLTAGSMLASLCFTQAFIPDTSTAAHKVYGWGYNFFIEASALAYAVLLVQGYLEMKKLEGENKLLVSIWVTGGGVCASMGIGLMAMQRITGNPEYIRCQPLALIAFYSIVAWSITFQRVFNARQIMVAIAEKVVLIAVISVLAFYANHLLIRIIPEDIAVILVVCTCVFAGAKINTASAKLFRKYPKADAARQSAFQAAETCTNPEDLKKEFTKIIARWSQSESSKIYISNSRGEFVGLGPLESEGLFNAVWATPEQLARTKPSPDKTALRDFLILNNFGAIALQKASRVAVIVAAGVKPSRKPYTYPELLQLQELGATMRSLLTTNIVSAQEKEREAAAAQILAHEQHLSNIFKSAPIGIGISKGGCITDVNEILCRITGYDKNFLTGKKKEILYASKDEFEKVRAEFRDNPDEINPTTIETRWKRRDGAIISIATRVTPIGEDEFIFSAEDITARKLLEDHFRQTQKMETIGTLAGGIAHDFNNILTALLMNMELIRSQNTDPTALTFLGDAEQLAKRAAKLTGQLLTFARKQTMQTERLNLNATLQNVAKMMERLLGENITVAFTPTKEDLWIEGDASMVDQAIMNLCLNARDAMPKGGSITIRNSVRNIGDNNLGSHPDAKKGQFFSVSVTDTGVGMANDVLQHLFEPFFTTKEIGKGTGLGLASVHGNMHQHNGWIDVTSKVGEGSTFTLYFPAAVKIEAEQPVEAKERKTGTETILLVEDEEPVRKVTSHVLTHLGYKVISVESGDKALGVWAARSKEIDMLFTDMMMPGITGLELGETLLKKNPNLRILLTSGYNDVMIQAKRRPDMSFIPKPFAIGTLATTIRDCLARPIIPAVA